jgi:hypothetical protein
LPACHALAKAVAVTRDPISVAYCSCPDAPDIREVYSQ